MFPMGLFRWNLCLYFKFTVDHIHQYQQNHKVDHNADRSQFRSIQSEGPRYYGQTECNLIFCHAARPHFEISLEYINLKILYVGITGRRYFSYLFICSLDFVLLHIRLFVLRRKLQ